MYSSLLVSYLDFFDAPGEIPFMYKKAGHKVTVFCCETSWLKSNKFYDEWIDASKEKEAFASALVKLINDEGEKFNKVVLLDDETIKLFNEYVTDEAVFLKIMPINKIENREMLSSKIGMSRVFERNGITTPRYINYSEGIDINELDKRLHFPVLLKVDFSFSGTGIRKCEKPSELKERLDELYDKENVVIQEFITGDDIGVEALFEKGELICYQCAKILEYMNNKFSFTTKRIYYRDTRIEQILTELGEKVGLNSFASIGFIYHKERDAYYLIEVDARTNSWMPYSRFTNHSFIDGLSKIAGIEKPNHKSNKKEETEIAIFDRDLRRCFKNKDINGIFKWVFNYKGYWQFIPVYDTKYFSRIMKKMIFDLLKIKY